MSFPISVRTELIKTKRSSAIWLCLIGAAFIPGIFFLMYVFKPENFAPKLKLHPWESFFINGWQAFSAFLLPMFVILICSLIMQIEYKNNTWKQVFASPQSLGDIFFSKLVTILMMILFMILLFNLFLFCVAILVNLIHKEYSFFNNAVPWEVLSKMNLKSIVSLLGIIAFQYWLSLRVKNFIVPIGIGLGLLITAIIMQGWEHIFKMPYAYPFLTFLSISSGGLKGALLQNHELNSIGYFIFFTALAFFDMKYRKERG